MKYHLRDMFWYYTVSSSLAVIIAFPVLMIVFVSFRSTTEINLNFSEFTLSNYFNIWDLQIRSNDNTFKQSLLNSLIVTSLTVVFSLTINILAGYSLSILKTPYKNCIFILLILPFLIPIYSIIIPLYVLLYKLNLNDSYWGLILVHTVAILPIGIFLMYNSFSAIPKSLREVALLNGSSEIHILLFIMLPLAIPGVITLIIYSIYISWNDYLLSFVIMNSTDMQMLNVTLSKISFRSVYPYAGYVISYTPFMIFFILLQKFYFRSIISSSER